MTIKSWLRGVTRLSTYGFSLRLLPYGIIMAIAMMFLGISQRATVQKTVSTDCYESYQTAVTQGFWPIIIVLVCWVMFMFLDLVVSIAYVAYTESKPKEDSSNV